MQFSTAILAALTVGASVFAAPERRNTVTVETITQKWYSTVNTLHQSVVPQVTQIKSLVPASTSDLVVAVDVHVKLVEIAASLTTAVVSIKADAIGAVTSITTHEGDLLVVVFKLFEEVVQAVIELVGSLTTNLVGAALTLVKTELDVIIKLFEPAFTPIETVAQSIIKNGALPAGGPVINSLTTLLSTSEGSVAHLGGIL